MDFLRLVHKKEYKADNKIIIGLVILFALTALTVLAVKFWPEPQYKDLLYYLPEDTSFYYYWSDKNSLSQNPLAQYNLYDQATAESQLDYLAGIFGPIFANVKEVIWFETAGGSSGSHYLIRLSHLQKKTYQELIKNNPEKHFFWPEDEVLFISSDQNIEPNLTAEPDGHSYLNDYARGTALYWQPGAQPEFLDGLSSYLMPLFGQLPIKANFYRSSNDKLIVNLYQTGNFDNFLYPKPSYLVVKDADFVLLFADEPTQDIFDYLENDLIRPLADKLPYYNLNSQAIAEVIFAGGLVLQKDDHWLVASAGDISSLILEFLDSYELYEVQNTLPDGTLYTEYIADEEQNKLSYQLGDEAYFQIGNLYTYQTGGNQYLSDSQALIQELIQEPQPVSGLWSECLGPEASAYDFMYFAVNQLEPSPIRDYFEDKSLSNIQIFSYSFDQISGIRFCL